MDMLLPGILSGLGIIVILMQFDYRKVLGYALFFDIVSTCLLAYIFLGTYSGMMAGIAGGLFVSASLRISKKFLGYKKLSKKGWVLYPSTW